MSQTSSGSEHMNTQIAVHPAKTVEYFVQTPNQTPAVLASVCLSRLTLLLELIDFWSFTLNLEAVSIYCEENKVAFMRLYQNLVKGYELTFYCVLMSISERQTDFLCANNFV